jgi:hypothetical protein
MYDNVHKYKYNHNNTYNSGGRGGGFVVGRGGLQRSGAWRQEPDGSWTPQCLKCLQWGHKIAECPSWGNNGGGNYGGGRGVFHGGGRGGRGGGAGGMAVVNT